MTKILVIEDEHLILENIIEILEMESYHVRGAPNGKLGLEIARDFLPDLIICDIMMPEVNGYDVLMELHSTSQMVLVPFIFLTARASRLDIRKGMSLGADDYLTKPFSAQELLEAVATRLGKKESVDTVYGQQLEELRESFTTAMPHELRTPLSGIMGYASLLMEDYQSLEPEDILKMSQRIFISATRLHRLFENYLLYAQIEISSRDPKRLARMKSNYTLDPATMIQAMAMARADTYQRSRDLSMDVNDANVQIAEDNLGKITTELVDNAFKFSKANTPVHIIAGIQDNYYCLQVTDQGYGIDADSLARIGAYVQFERKLHEQQGVGLGLIIARKLAELSGGQLIIESKLDEGTTVTALLPLNNEHQ